MRWCVTSCASCRQLLEASELTGINILKPMNLGLCQWGARTFSLVVRTPEKCTSTLSIFTPVPSRMIQCQVAGYESNHLRSVVRGHSHSQSSSQRVWE